MGIDQGYRHCSQAVVASPSGLANAAFKRTIVAAIGGNPPEPCNLSHERQSPTAGGALALSIVEGTVYPLGA